jgi:hypothetical protein
MSETRGINRPRLRSLQSGALLLLSLGLSAQAQAAPNSGDSKRGASVLKRGDYEDFLTGFVVSDSAVWGRPLGVAVTHDGSLLVSEDANGTCGASLTPGWQRLASET